ncbi:hypothetical protein [Rhodococcus sp. IEGM1428]|uniref:hypothetical protein n=1 Tax=Rhodococcus sp. IEGM1428 TaxID=3392191 RepID=UPI003D11D777
MTTLPELVVGWIGAPKYPITSMRVEEGMVWTFCAAVEDGADLHWRSASETGVPARTPQTMLSVWSRPDNWSPTGVPPGALQTHFDLKRELGLPEAIISRYALTLHDPVLIGDVLRVYEVIKKVSEPKTTRLGHGRFWDIEVVFERPDGGLAGTETYTAFGYNRE